MRSSIRRPWVRKSRNKTRSLKNGLRDFPWRGSGSVGESGSAAGLGNTQAESARFSRRSPDPWPEICDKRSPGQDVIGLVLPRGKQALSSGLFFPAWGPTICTPGILVFRPAAVSFGRPHGFVLREESTDLNRGRYPDSSRAVKIVCRQPVWDD